MGVLSYHCTECLGIRKLNWLTYRCIHIHFVVHGSLLQGGILCSMYFSDIIMLLGVKEKISKDFW